MIIQMDLQMNKTAYSQLECWMMKHLHVDQNKRKVTVEFLSVLPENFPQPPTDPQSIIERRKTQEYCKVRDANNELERENMKLRRLLRNQYGHNFEYKQQR